MSPRSNESTTRRGSRGDTAPTEGGGAAAIYIKQAAQMVGVAPSTIRAWERQGLTRSGRTAAGYRLYTPADVQRLRRIRDLFQIDGLNPAGVRQMLRLSGDDVPSSATAQSDTSDGLGVRIRRLRRRQGISLRELGARTGLSPSYISALERSRGRPSIASLQKLAAALGTNLSLMLGDEAGSSSDQLVVRPHQRRKLHLDTPGIVMEQLTVEEQDLEPTVVRIAPGAGSEDSYHHEGEEFIFVLDGTFEITLEESDIHLLESGDAITFRSHRPHRWRNPGASETVLIWVNTPPTF